MLLAAGAAAIAGAAGSIVGFNILRKRRKNVVFIIADAARYDLVGRKGPGGKSLTPFIDSQTAGGAIYTNSLSASSWTLPSVAGLMSSRNPIITRDTYSESYANGAMTMAEAFAASGYFTCAVVKNPWLPIRTATGEALPMVVTRGFAKYVPGGVKLEANPLFEQGVGQVQEFVAFPPAEMAVDEAKMTLASRRAGQPFFLYMHFMNTHEPYSPSPVDMSIADAAAPPVEGVPDHMIFKVLRHRAELRGKEILEEEDAGLMARAKALYEAAMASTDAAVGRIAEYLAREGELENTVFVVTADHGEEMGEHGWFGHSVTLYHEVLHVPLAMWGPGVKALRSGGLVSGVDIAPGVLALAGIETPEGADGDAEWPAGAGGGAREAVSSTVYPPLPRKLVSVTTSLTDSDGRKVIWKRPIGEAAVEERLSMYDLSQDPGEKTDVSAGREAEASWMSKRIEWYASNAARRGMSGAIEIDNEMEKQLRSLGYFN